MRSGPALEVARVSADRDKPVIVATGAFDCGKTTTLEWLRDHHGKRIHDEAHLRALARLGDRTAGHPAGQGFFRIDAPDHICPMCRPWDFAAMVLAEQEAIEESARAWDILERGSIDPIEMYLRNSDLDDLAPRPPSMPIADYRLILLFDVMPALQRPRWGKSVDVRVREARAINRRLLRLYERGGYDVVRIRPGTVEERAAAVLAAIAVLHP
ncbi:MAG: ATP-binding protein [Myxococcales bacterium]|nr:ATP-binding protein [Myxococcales bacterium]